MTDRESLIAAAKRATSALLEDVADEHREAVDEYLAHYLDPTERENDRCPECGGWFTWGDAWGAGYCSSCHYPARLYHVVSDVRDEPTLICHATVNGYRVCEAPRGEHVPKDVTWHRQDGTSFVEVELRCPDPKPVSGLRNDLPRWERYKAPEIVRFNMLLWAHPEYVKPRAES